MVLEWTHSISLEFPNNKKYYWYEIVFLSPEGIEEKDRPSYEDVEKEFEKFLKAKSFNRTTPTNPILLMKDLPEPEIQVLQEHKDFHIRGGRYDYLQDAGDGNFCCQIISLFRIKPFPENFQEIWHLSLINLCKITDNTDIGGGVTFSELMAQIIFADFDPEVAFAPTDMQADEDDKEHDENEIPVRERAYRYDSFRFSHFYEHEDTRKVHLAVIVENIVEDYTLLQYMAIVRDAFENDDNKRDESLDQVIDEAIQFQVVYNEDLDVYASIDGIRKDARPNSCMTVSANLGGRRTYNKKLTIKSMYEKQGLHISVDDQPICFQNKHEKDGYLSVAFDNGANMRDVDWLKKVVIVPELWTMTGTVDPQKQQYLAVANTDRYRMENSILAHAQKAIRFMFQMATKLHLMFPVWLADVGCSIKPNPDLIARGRENIKLKKVAIKNWTVMARSELEALGSVKTNMMNIASDSGIKIKAPAEIHIDEADKNDPKAWVAKLPETWETNKSSLLWIVMPVFREDIYREIKKRCVNIHLPLLVQTEFRFPKSDRDRWIEKYSKNRVNELITKLGAPKQTRNWTLSGYPQNKTILIIAIWESHGYFSFVYNHQERNKKFLKNQFNHCNTLRSGQKVVKLSDEYMQDGQMTYMQDIAEAINKILQKLKKEPDEILLLAGGDFNTTIFNQMMEDANKLQWSTEEGMISSDNLFLDYINGNNLKTTMAKVEENKGPLTENHILVNSTKEFLNGGAARACIRPIRIHLIERSVTMTHYMLQTILYDLLPSAQHSIYRKRTPELWPLIYARKICNRLDSGIVADIKEHFNENPEGIVFI